MTKHPHHPRTIARSRRLRADSTGPEAILWGVHRSRQLGGLKFRRQHPIGPYVVDFYCDSARLVVEIDGLSHDETAESDARRSEYLQQAGLRIVRVLNDEVLRDLDAVAEMIVSEARTGNGGICEQFQPPSPQPSPEGRGSRYPNPPRSG
jgi:very-short-patch-repair endonuclease